MQTIIAAFDDRQHAQRAADNLIQQGFARDAVHLQSGYDEEVAPAAAAGDSHDGFFARIGDFFGKLFGDDDSSGQYAESVRRGGTVVVVDAATDDEVETARSLLTGSGSVDVEARAAEWRSAGWTGWDANAQPHGSAERAGERPGALPAVALGQTVTAVAQHGQTLLPVVQEGLSVGKRRVDTGGVRVIQRVTETPVSELVRLRDERATIERRPVDRAATEADFANFKEGTIELRETAEEAVVSKSARVVEEVVVGTEVTERTETISDTVRRADVEVERVGDGDFRDDRGSGWKP